MLPEICQPRRLLWPCRALWMGEGGQGLVGSALPGPSLEGPPLVPRCPEPCTEGKWARDPLLKSQTPCGLQGRVTHDSTGACILGRGQSWRLLGTLVCQEPTYRLLWLLGEVSKSREVQKVAQGHRASRGGRTKVRSPPATHSSVRTCTCGQALLPCDRTQSQAARMWHQGRALATGRWSRVAPRGECGHMEGVSGGRGASGSLPLTNEGLPNYSFTPQGPRRLLCRQGRLFLASVFPSVKWSRSVGSLYTAPTLKACSQDPGPGLWVSKLGTTAAHHPGAPDLPSQGQLQGGLT